MHTQQITFKIESRLEDVPLLGTLVNALCKSVKLSLVDSNHVEVCIVEAANNAIRHAYHDAPGHFVELVVNLLPDQLIFDICDSGSSASPEIMHADRRHTLDAHIDLVEQLSESGRGLAIMRELMDSFEYMPGTARNRLRLTKRLTKGRR